jgi:hypothetical protein
MSHEIRSRITRPATPEEAARHQQLRDEIAQELPELSERARQAAASHRDRISVDTVFEADESPVLTAIDAYAAKHALPGRSAVVREALAQLLGIPVRQQ